MKLKTIDLCAGIGGIRRGFELAGDYTNIASAEIDEMACKTYEHLYHENPYKCRAARSVRCCSGTSHGKVLQLRSS